MENIKNVIICICIVFCSYLLFAYLSEKEEVKKVNLKYELIKDSMNLEISKIQISIDSLQNTIDSINKVDSILIDSLKQNKIIDDENYKKIMGSGADSSYNIIIKSIH